MKLHAAVPGAANAITAYGEDYVAVNAQRYPSSLVVTPDRVLAWEGKTFELLSVQDFEFLKDLGMDIIVLGTGPRQRFPHPRLSAPLLDARIGLEVMDLRAACRTYNILVAEERKVAAALLFA